MTKSSAPLTSSLTATAKRPLSIRQVARLAGVSPSTVSRILNDPEEKVAFSPKTRKRVLDLCQQVNYQPNINAKRLFANRSHVLGLAMVPSIPLTTNHTIHQHTSFDTCLMGISEEAELRHQNLLLVNVNSTFLEKQKYLELFRSKMIDGLLAWGALQDHHYLQELHYQGYPVVCLITTPQHAQVPHVIANDHHASEQMAEHLLSLGHKKIVYLSGAHSASVATNRCDGFVNRCRQANISITVVPCSFNYEEAKKAAWPLLSCTPRKRPTAIVAANDFMAIGVIEIAHQLGLRVPEDLSVAGADDQMPLYRPRLTTLATPVYELGKQGIDLLLQRIEQTHTRPGKSGKSPHTPAHPLPNNIILDATLKIGQTTAPPPKVPT